MTLTFPIDKVPLEAIPQLAPILECHPNHAGLILYAAYLYDPKNEVITEAKTLTERGNLARDFAGCAMPELPEPGTEPSEEFIAYGDIVGLVFRLHSNFEYELLKSREIMLERMMGIARSVEEGADSAKQITVWSAADLAIEQTLGRYNALVEKLCLADKVAIEAYKIARGKVKREPISPEGMKGKT